MPRKTVKNPVNQNTVISSNQGKNAYDEVPYASFPYPYSSHERLHTIGKLFGMQPADFTKARVLELGCASGGNIMPLAAQYPDSEFTGIDASRVQIDMAIAHVRNLGLKNIEFRYQSIMDITDSLGKFDYIIVHGILSWVPPEVQDKIFEVCNKNLAANGIAYISYNTYPGWNFIKCLRDMMLYHTASFADPAMKVKEAANLLAFIRKANKSAENNPYLQVIGNELKMFETADASYLLHDHLEEHNEPYYFHQFMHKAHTHTLQYLGETTLSSMYVGNLAEEAAKTLWQISNDIVRVEQYMDFIKNRRFRCTLVVHDTVKINRNLTPDSLKSFYITTGLKTDADLDHRVPNNQKIIFNIPGRSVTFSTASIEVVETMKLLIKQGNKPISVRKLLDMIKANLGDQFRKNSEEAILKDFLRLVFADAIGIYSSEGNFSTEVSRYPKAAAYARYQASSSTWITNQRSEKINTDIFTRILLQYLNGENDIAGISIKMLRHFDNNELQIKDAGHPITDKNEIKTRVKLLVNQYLQNLAASAILVS